MLPLGSSEITRIAPTLISRMAFGVRYETQFAVMDRSGAVVDAILRASGTPFGPERFPLSQADVNTSLLTDLEDGSFLRISQQDVILQLTIHSRNLNRIDELGDDFDRFVLTPLRKLAGLSGIQRYGVLLTMDEIKGLKHRPVHHYLSSEFPDANSLAMRFTRRLPADEALVRKDVEDYRNAIYTLRETDEGEVAVSIDYQEYFKPALSSSEWSSKPFAKFVSRGLAHFEGESERLLKQFVGVAEVA